jgi:uncharacterized protein DUF4388
VADALPISGNIDPKTFPFLLMDLHRHGATGSLKVDGPTYQKALYFRGGRVLFGSSNDPRDQLGAILIEAGKITPEHLEDVNAKVGPGNPLAKVLADTGFVNQRELSESARAKVERILSDVIAYTSGSFEFEDGVLPKGAIDLKLSTEKVLLAAVRRITDRAFVLRHLEDLEVVLSAQADKSSALAELQADTGGLVDHFDSNRTLKEAASRTRLDEFEAAKVACALLFLGLVRRGAQAPAFGTLETRNAELDLGATASAAFITEPSLPPEFASTVDVSAPESPFFVADAEPEAEPPIPPPEPAPPAPGPVAPPRAVTPSPPLIMPEPEPAVVLAPPRPEPSAPAPEAPPSDSTVRMEPTLVEPPAPRSRSAGPALVYPPNAPSRSRPEPAKPSPSRPSKDDLAALDVLLNPKAHAGPLAPMESAGRDDAWGPQFNEAQRESRGLPRGALVGAGVLVLVVFGGLWYYRQNPDAFAFGRRAREAPPSPTFPTAAPLIPPTPAPPTTPGAEAPPTTMAAAPPRTMAVAPPPVSIPTPTATVPVVTRPPATPPPTPPASVNLLEQARTALRGGNHAEAARAFAAHIRRAPRGTATVQLLVACSTDTVQKAMSEVGSSELFILPVSYQGRDCYRMCWGLYADAARAASAVRSLPDYFRRGGASPRVVTAAEVLP